MHSTRLPFNQWLTTHEWNTHTCFFCSFDLDLDPMTIIHRLDLNNLKTYPDTNNEFSRSRLSKVRALKMDRQKNVTENIKCAFTGGKNWRVACTAQLQSSALVPAGMGKGKGGTCPCPGNILKCFLCCKCCLKSH